MSNLSRVVYGVAMAVAILGAMYVGLALLENGCRFPGGRGFQETVEPFRGRLVQDGSPVSFAKDEQLDFVTVYTGKEGVRRFGIPLRHDGNFEIGWMPVGKYSATFTRLKAGRPRTESIVCNLPEFAIEQGKTEYQIDLGEDYKP